MKKSSQTELPSNNPFTIGLNGLTTLFALAKSVAIFAVVLSVVSFISNIAQNVSDISQRSTGKSQSMSAVPSFTTEQLIIGGVILATVIFVLILISAFIGAILDYTSAQLAKHERVTLREASAAAISELPGYIWLTVVLSVKVLLWTLLFIVPGIIMSVRYALSGTVFFAEGLRGNAATKRSAELTKGAWFTTFASHTLWNLMTLGLIQYILQPGINALLYAQLRPPTDAQTKKPRTHIVSWITFGITILLFLAIIILLIGALILLQNISKSFGP